MPTALVGNPPFCIDIWPSFPVVIPAGKIGQLENDDMAGYLACKGCELRNELRWRSALIAYLTVLAIVGFWPAPVDRPIQGTLSTVLRYLHDHGVPSWFNYHFVEAAANVALFIPLGSIAALTFRAKTWWHLTLLGCVVSVAMELGQLIFMTERVPSIVDVVTNTGGAVIGIFLVRSQDRSKSP